MDHMLIGDIRQNFQPGLLLKSLEFYVAAYFLSHYPYMIGGEVRLCRTAYYIKMI